MLSNTFGTLLGVLLLAATASAQSQKGVSVTLGTKWEATPYMLEAAEFLADEEPALYWRFVDAWARRAGSDDSDTCWRDIVTSASELLSPGVAKMVPVSLAVRQYSARLRMYEQLASQLYQDKQHSCCFLDLDGVVVERPEDLEQAVQDAAGAAEEGRANDSSTQIFPFDHVYNTKQHREDAIVGVLWGPLGAPCFSAWHEALKPATERHSAAARPLLYIYRPLRGASCRTAGGGACAALGAGGKLLLPGFGVEAVLKNMEYSAMDDQQRASKAAQGASEDAAATDESLGEAKGFLFDTLVARKPHLKQELLTFRDQLLSSDDGDTLKVWDMQDLGLQATQRIAQAADPLLLLTDIAQNFPSLGASLSRQAVNSTLRRSVERNQRAISAGTNVMLLNGLLVDLDNFELYSFLERLRGELRLADMLAGAGVTGEGAQAVLRTRADDSSASLEEVRLDLGPLDHVILLNDVETDKMYAGWPSNVGELLNTYPGRLRSIRKNMYNAVYLLDPMSAAGLAVAPAVLEMWQGRYPVRFGLLPLVPEVAARVRHNQRHSGTPREVPEWADMGDSERFARALLMLKSAWGPARAFELWAEVADDMADMGVDAEYALESCFKHQWAQAAKNPVGLRAKQAAKRTAAQAWTQLQEGSGFASEVGMALNELTSYALRKGVVSLDKPRLWLNGVLHAVNESPGMAAQELMYNIMAETQQLQELIYYGKLTDGAGPVLQQLMRLQQSVRRWSPLLMGAGAAGVAVPGALGDQQGAGLKVNLARALGSDTAASIRYLEPHRNASLVKPVSQWVVADVSSAQGRELLQESLRFLLNDEEEAKNSRVAWLLNPTDAAGPPSALEKLLLTAVEEFREPTLPQLQWLVALLDDADLCSQLGHESMSSDTVAAVEALAAEYDLDGAAIIAHSTADGDAVALQRWQHHLALAADVLQLRPGVSAVVTNGRVTVVHDPAAVHPQHELGADDFALLQLLAQKYQGAGALAEAVAEVTSGASVAHMDDIVLAAASAFGAQTYPDMRYNVQNSKSLAAAIKALKSDGVKVTADNATSALQISAVINPLTRAAQRTSQVLLFLRQFLEPRLQLHLNPATDLSEMPLRSFYRFALPDVQHADQLPGPPSAHFNRLPANRVLTLNLEPPESWLIEPSYATCDLDNLRLADVPERVVQAEYELEALLLTGSCADMAAVGRGGSSRPTPPRGLQLHLGTSQQPHQVDTLVMANLGYFQLKAAPGLWQLTLAPGRSRQLYSMRKRTAEDADVGVPAAPAAVAAGSSTNDKGADGGDISTQVVLSSFTGKQMFLRVAKRPGMEQLELLEEVTAATDGKDSQAAAAGAVEQADPPADKGVWGTITSLFGGRTDPAKAAAPVVGDGGDAAANATAAAGSGEVINVFTVASGHMYERLQKIMMLSVIKNTKSRVKFWIIKNYISPQHRAVIPAMAARYGFDVAFVTYKWPHWLHKQTDKQRIIWAYKILFLDVLFPLDVGRVIFVDSDQVVRADLAELVRMDLKGAVAAYTPFCDNNREMDEYRFWKGGFWAEHLRGRPYHISALYVIDLRRFRKRAAGDQYRSIYQQLSQDPNSLANLDQDLPNYAQHNIPLFSLPQEWLWCESWCGNETKARAKTIDLCNNPKTKEPKLSAAKRIVPEWVDLDREVAEFTATVGGVAGAQVDGDEDERDAAGGVDGIGGEAGGGDAASGSTPAAGSQELQSATAYTIEVQDRTEL